MNANCKRAPLFALLLGLGLVAPAFGQNGRWRDLDAPNQNRSRSTIETSDDASRPNEQVRRIDGKLAIGQADGLSIDHKFGDVAVEIGPGNEVTYTVEIRAWSRNTDAAQRLVNEIRVEESAEGNTLYLRTKYPEGNNNNWGARGFRVNYRLKVPPQLALRIKNAFGAITVPDLKTPTRLESSYGSLTAGNLQHPDTYVEIKFGSGDIQGVEAGSISLSYVSNIDFQRLGNVTFKQQFSKVRIGSAQQINLEAKYGEVRVASVTSLTGNASFSPVTISRLGRNLNLTTKYVGTLEVDQVAAGFEQIRLEGSFSNYRLRFDPAADFSFDANLRYGNLNYPREDVTIQHMEKESNRATYEGRFGRGGSSKVVLNTSYGNVNLSRN